MGVLEEEVVSALSVVKESEEEEDLGFDLSKGWSTLVADINPTVINHTSICSFYLMKLILLNFSSLNDECYSLAINVLC